MDFVEYRGFDAVALAALLRRREVTPRELLEIALARAEEVQPRLGAITVWDLEFAERRLQALPQTAPFAGVPFLLKDLYAFLEGTRFTNGSRLTRDLRADFTSTLFTRVLRAGFVPFAKTNAPEFGENVVTEPLLHGPCRNPWNGDFSPGGSSGGAAAAVAAGVVPLAHATDGGGSIRIPASHCGLVGLKPSRARVPIGPVVVEAWSGLATGLALARSLRDLALFLDAVHGPEPGDFYACPPPRGPFAAALARPPAQLRIGLLLEPAVAVAVEPAVRHAVLAIARLLEQMGHIVEESRLPLDGERFAEAFLTVVATNSASELDYWSTRTGRPLDEEHLERGTLALLEMGRRRSGVEFLRALQTVQAAARLFGRLFARFDLLLSPVCAKPPPRIGEIDQNDRDVSRYLARTRPYVCFTSLHNASGCPALALPAGQSPEGLPIGVMLAAPLGEEERLFALGAELERELRWFRRTPPEPAGSEEGAQATE